MAAPLPRPCPSENTIAGFVDGALTDDGLADCEAHVADCDDCRRVLREMVRVSAHPSEAARTSASAASDARLPPLALPALAPVSRDRYTIEREIARGGMGRILRAWDAAHRRRVALKVLLRSGAEASWRFAREVAITAQLQHPSIIPLYEAGRWTDGEPFFAMKLVEGTPLSVAIEQTTSLKERLAFVPNLIAALDALAYAHAQGIVHRDLKPANVLLGAYGETVVIDWGLAKAVDARAQHCGVAHGLDAVRADATAAGYALGTPSYMPPEQARGEPIDMRADVYALGAMLYHLLAGTSPYEGTSSREVLAQLLAGPPVPLGVRVPALAPDLAAIVDKAMEREPSGRYPSAEPMAADLKHFAAGQLVSAHTYSVPERARRWVAKRRAAVATATAFFVALLFTGVVSVRRVVRERNRADAAKTVAERERSTAVTQRDAAERLVQFAIGQLRDRLEPLGKLDLLAGLGGEVDAYYRSVDPADDALDGPALKRRGTAIDVLAGVELAKHNPEVAGALSQTEEAIYERVLAHDEGDIEARLALADANVTNARAAWDKGDGDAAVALSRIATQIAKEAVDRAPGDARTHVVHAAAAARMAFLLSQRGDAQSAREAGELALADLDDVGEGERLEPRWQDQLGRALGDIAKMRWATADETGSLGVYRRFVAVNERLAKAKPSDTNRTFELARSQFEMAALEYQLGILDEQTSAVAIEALRSLVPIDPTNREWRGILLQALAGACDARRENGQLDGARAMCREGLAIGRRLRADGATDARTEAKFVYALTITGSVEHDAGHWPEAIALLEEGLAIDVAILGRDPGSRNAMLSTLNICRYIASAQLAQRRLDAADATLTDGIERADHYLAAAQDAWHETYFRTALAIRRAHVWALRGDSAAAERSLRQSLEELARIRAAVPNYQEASKGTAEASVELAALLLTARRGAEARELLHSAIGLLQPMHDKAELEPERQDVLRKAKRMLGS
jgi:tetratricopeptide (TPR) repeat protein